MYCRGGLETVLWHPAHPEPFQYGLGESQQAVNFSTKSREWRGVQNLYKLGFVRQSTVTSKKCACTSQTMRFRHVYHINYLVVRQAACVPPPTAPATSSSSLNDFMPVQYGSYNLQNRNRLLYYT